MALVAFWIPVFGAMGLFDRIPLGLRIGRSFRRLGRLFCRVYPWRIHISGREHLKPNRVYIIVSNHQSLTDIPIISHLKLDTKWLARAELFQVPVVGWMLRKAGDIPVARSDPHKRAVALLRSAKYLRRRCSVVFFPEGTRSPDGQVQPFWDGAFRLAIHEQVPILPLVVEGTGAVLPLNSWLFGKNRDIRLRVLEEVPVDSFTLTQTAELRDAVRQRIVEELQRLRQAEPADRS